MKTTMQTKIQTKTIAAIALATLAVGSIVFVLTFISRNTGQTLSGNPYTGTASQTTTASPNYIGPPVSDNSSTAPSGLCGSANGGTFATAPTTNLCADAGTELIVVTGTGPWYWTCPGISGGSASCSALKSGDSQNSGADLAFNKATKGELGLPCPFGDCDTVTSDLQVSGGGIMHNGEPINVSMGVKNYGTADSGSFTVKIWKSVDTIPGNVKQDASKDCESNGIFIDRPDALLATWNIDSLKSGESIRKKFENLTTSGWTIHKFFNFIIEIDADDNVAETNESNNVFMRECIPQSR